MFKSAIRRSCSRGGGQRGLLHGKGADFGLSEGFGTISLNVLLSGRHRKKLDTVTLSANTGLER